MTAEQAFASALALLAFDEKQEWVSFRLRRIPYQTVKTSRCGLHGAKLRARWRNGL